METEQGKTAPSQLVSRVKLAAIVPIPYMWSKKHFKKMFRKSDCVVLGVQKAKSFSFSWTQLGIGCWQEGFLPKNNGDSLDLELLSEMLIFGSFLVGKARLVVDCTEL